MIGKTIHKGEKKMHLNSEIIKVMVCAVWGYSTISKEMNSK
jgi:hypothetical protein